MTFSSDPLVSIVIPVYNAAGTVADAIESCLAQSYRAREIVVVDDGSTDATASVLAKFGGAIRVIAQSNRGLAAARNRGTEVARGEVIAWMDGDDLCHRDRLALQVEVLRAEPSVALVFSDFSGFSLDPATGATTEVSSYIRTYYGAVRSAGALASVFARATSTAHYPDALDAAHHSSDPLLVRIGSVRDRLIRGNFVHPPTVTVRRSAMDAAGRFDESLRSGSDFDLILRLAALGDFAMIEAPLLRYRLSATQMSRGFGAAVTMRENVAILEKLRAHDPTFAAAHAELISQQIARSLLSAASDLSESDRREALRLMRQSVHEQALWPGLVRVAARVACPPLIYDVVRRWKRGTGSPH